MDRGGAGDELLRPGLVLDRDAGAWVADPQEGEIVILAGGGPPGPVDVDLGDRPDPVRRRPVVVAGHELDGARAAGHAVRGGDHQVAGRAVDHARRAEVLAELSRGTSGQCSDGRLAGERLAVARWHGQVPDGPGETGHDVTGRTVNRGEDGDEADGRRGDQRRLRGRPDDAPGPPAFQTQHRDLIVMDGAPSHQRHKLQSWSEVDIGGWEFPVSLSGPASLVPGAVARPATVAQSVAFTSGRAPWRGNTGRTVLRSRPGWPAA